MNYSDDIRAKARELLASGQVQVVIGYEEGRRGQVRPAFIYKADDTDRLIFDERCAHNLAVYLHAKKAGPQGAEPPKVAIVAKPCDARAINVLTLENQVSRENLYIIGVACDGTKDKDTGGTEFKCTQCSERVPVVYDCLIGTAPTAATEPTEPFADIVEFEKMSPAERRAFWEKQYARCIRCYACRQACPMCYCEECVVEKLDPLWVSIAIDTPEKEFYHLMRAFHLTGRCTGCGECERACPLGIPVMLYNRKMAKEIQAVFGGFRPGSDAVAAAPFATFKKEEID